MSSHLVNSHFVNFTSSIPTLSTSHFVNSHIVNVDKVVIDKVGSWRSGNWQSGKFRKGHVYRPPKCRGSAGFRCYIGLSQVVLSGNACNLQRNKPSIRKTEWTILYGESCIKTRLMKGTEVPNPRRSSMWFWYAHAQTYNQAAHATQGRGGRSHVGGGRQLIDGPGLGHTTRSAAYLSRASCVIVSGFRAAMDLDT